MTLESDIKRRVRLDTCDRVDWLNNPVGVVTVEGRTIAYGAGGEGASDLLGVLRGPGLFVACEVKVPGWKPRNKKDRDRWAKQLQFLGRIQRSGGLAFCAHSVEEVKLFLKQYSDRKGIK